MMMMMMMRHLRDLVAPLVMVEERLVLTKMEELVVVVNDVDCDKDDNDDSDDDESNDTS